MDEHGKELEEVPLSRRLQYTQSVEANNNGKGFLRAETETDEGVRSAGGDRKKDMGEVGNSMRVPNGLREERQERQGLDLTGDL